MKTVGKRTEPIITFHATADNLREGARFNEETQRIAGKSFSPIPKGVYHFKTQEEANEHWNACCVKEVVRRNTK
jgi:hypothetical protein